jgi:hypothetical protein
MRCDEQVAAISKWTIWIYPARVLKKLLVKKQIDNCNSAAKEDDKSFS